MLSVHRLEARRGFPCVDVGRMHASIASGKVLGARRLARKRRHLTPRRVRAFVDFLAEALAQKAGS